jgi:Ice-binding-like
MKKVLIVICMLTTGSLCRAQAPSLGAAASFAVLGGTNVTCTAPGVITGDVGVSPGAAAPFTNTGCAFAGTGHVSDPAAFNARADFLNAYTVLKDNLLTPCTQTISSAAFTSNVPALGPLPPGVYCFPAAVTFTDTTLTLDGSTNPNGIWIFKVAAALTASGFQMVMANGGRHATCFGWSTPLRHCRFRRCRRCSKETFSRATQLMEASQLLAERWLGVPLQTSR